MALVGPALVGSALIRSALIVPGDLAEPADRGHDGEMLPEKPKRPNTLVLVAIGIGHLAVVALTWRDLRSRSAGQVRGSKTVWRTVSAMNTVGSGAYWLLGRRRAAD